MQILSKSSQRDHHRPEECRECGGHRLHRHGTYERGAIWLLKLLIEIVVVQRFLCVDCRKTTSVLPWGLIAYRLLSLEAVRKSLYDNQQQHQRELLQAYRRRWEKWYGNLRRGIGNIFGELPKDAKAGWERLGFAGRNTELVDRTGWSLFGRYRIHVPQTVY